MRIKYEINADRSNTLLRAKKHPTKGKHFLQHRPFSSTTLYIHFFLNYLRISHRIILRYPSETQNTKQHSFIPLSTIATFLPKHEKNRRVTQHAHVCNLTCANLESVRYIAKHICQSSYGWLHLSVPGSFSQI